MICIYHSRDLDGYCSGAIVKKRYPDCKLIGYDYGKPIPWDEIPEDEQVIMIDVSLPMTDMFKLADKVQLFTWIDHHATAIADYKNYLDGEASSIHAVLEDGISACEGTWKYLFPNQEMPWAVLYLGEYDTWRNENKIHWDNNIMPFQFGMRLNVKDADSFPQSLLAIPENIDGIDKYFREIFNIKQHGFTILQYQREQNAMAMKGSFVIDFEGLRALACNGGGFNSSVFDSVWDEDIHDCMMPFKFDGKKWSFSLYTTKDIDLSVIAKKYGGGGHKKACGFQLTELPTFLFKP